MPKGYRTHGFSRFVMGTALTGLLAGSVLLTTSHARAQESDLSPTGKGITGGALLGSEAVMSVEAALSVKNPWFYVLGGVVGAGAGGFGGYYLEQNSDPHNSYYLLAGGLALAIPTTVAILQATSYDYEDNYSSDATPADVKPANSPQPEASTAPAKVARKTRPVIPMSLVGLQQGDLRMGIPALALIPSYTPTEMKKFGVEQQTEVRMPVFSAIF